jgi:hypothetical protein
MVERQRFLLRVLLKKTISVVTEYERHLSQEPKRGEKAVSILHVTSAILAIPLVGIVIQQIPSNVVFLPSYLVILSLAVMFLAAYLVLIHFIPSVIWTKE